MEPKLCQVKVSGHQGPTLIEDYSLIICLTFLNFMQSKNAARFTVGGTMNV